MATRNLSKRYPKPNSGKRFTGILESPGVVNPEPFWFAIFHRKQFPDTSIAEWNQLCREYLAHQWHERCRALARHYGVETSLFGPPEGWELKTLIALACDFAPGFFQVPTHGIAKRGRKPSANLDVELISSVKGLTVKGKTTEFACAILSRQTTGKWAGQNPKAIRAKYERACTKLWSQPDDPFLAWVKTRIKPAS